MKNIKYFLYARKSSESEDRQAYSIQDQKIELHRLSETLGLQIIDIIEESQSAKKPGRPKFNQMIERIHKGEADGILCWKLNRLARNPIDGGQISWLLQKGLIKHIQTQSNDYKPTDNVIMMQVEFGMANQFINDLREGIRRGVRLKAERGWYPSASLPVGYSHNKDSKMEIVQDDRISIVIKLFNLALSGTYSISQLQEKGTEMGLRSQRGKILGRTAYYNLFRNEFYCGFFYWKNSQGIKQKFQGKHKAILTVSEFEKVQTAINKSKNNRQFRSIKAKKNESFMGIMKCGECSCAITSERHFLIKCPMCNKKFSGKHTSVCSHCSIPVQDLKKYLALDITYFRCTKKKKKCSQSYIKQDDLFTQFYDLISLVHLTNDEVTFALSILDRLNKSDARRSEINTLKKQQIDCEVRYNKLLELHLNELIPETVFKSKSRNFTDQLSQIKTQILKLKQSKASNKSKISNSANVITNCLSKFKNGSIEDKRRILSAIGSNYRVFNKKLYVAIPLEIMHFLSLNKIGKKKEPSFERLETDEAFIKSTDLKHSGYLLSLLSFGWSGKTVGRNTPYGELTDILICPTDKISFPFNK